jgi:nucleoside-diphosphate-sugar epimerase
VSAPAASPRALVTGAGGFIGRHLVAALLAEGRAVHALDLQLGSLPSHALLTRFEGDVADPRLQARAVEGVGSVFHLAAAHLGVLPSDAEFERINVAAVRSLARAAARAGVARFVHTSSVGVYGRIADPPADEATPCRPKLAYEKTKLAGERALLETAAELRLPAVVLRPAWVYGPGCPRTEKLLRAIARGRFVVGGSGRSLRHCLHVSDMLRAFACAELATGADGQAVIVGEREPVTIRTLVDEIAALVGARPPRALPLPLLRMAALGAELAFRPLRREPPISRRTLEFFTSNTAFRTDRARKLLGFEPTLDLRAGLAATWAVLGARA